MGVYVIHYDYGTGSTHLAVEAPSEAQIEEALKYVRVVDPGTAGPSSELVNRLKSAARALDDPFWDELRR